MSDDFSPLYADGVWPKFFILISWPKHSENCSVMTLGKIQALCIVRCYQEGFVSCKRDNCDIEVNCNSKTVVFGLFHHLPHPPYSGYKKSTGNSILNQVWIFITFIVKYCENINQVKITRNFFREKRKTRKIPYTAFFVVLFVFISRNVPVFRINQSHLNSLNTHLYLPAIS